MSMVMPMFMLHEHDIEHGMRLDLNTDMDADTETDTDQEMDINIHKFGYRISDIDKKFYLTPNIRVLLYNSALFSPISSRLRYTVKFSRILLWEIGLRAHVCY
jgi:hypothetical protein